jgi:hypothetical protein
VTANGPALPRIPPQIHHQNTTSCHLFFPKTPVKHHKHPESKNERSKSRKIVISG